MIEVIKLDDSITMPLLGELNQIKICKVDSALSNVSRVSTRKVASKKYWDVVTQIDFHLHDTVDGRNPTPVDR